MLVRGKAAPLKSHTEAELPGETAEPLRFLLLHCFLRHFGVILHRSLLSTRVKVAKPQLFYEFLKHLSKDLGNLPDRKHSITKGF